MNGKEKEGYHPQNNAWFDILNLANQLHKSKSTYSEGPKHGKTYFSENQVSNLLEQEKEYLFWAIKSYKEAVKKNLVYKEDGLMLKVETRVENEAVDKLFVYA